MTAPASEQQGAPPPTMEEWAADTQKRMALLETSLNDALKRAEAAEARATAAEQAASQRTAPATSTAPQPTSAPIPDTIPHTRKGPKIAVPDVFNGDRSKTESFVRQFLVYTAVKQAEFATDAEKIMFVISYMKGGIAGQWADRKVDEYTFLHSTPNFNEFVEEFKATFSDPDRANTARMAMSRLTQGARTADEYIADFRELAGRTGYNDTAHIEHFENGLNKPIVEKIYNLPVMPETLEDWATYASRFDLQYRKFRAHHSIAANTRTRTTPPFNNNPPKPATTATTTSIPAPSTGPAPMDIDRTRSTAFTCYNCGKPGHISRNCPSPQRARYTARTVETPAEPKIQEWDRKGDFGEGQR